jgi:hypothetical protein
VRTEDDVEGDVLQNFHFFFRIVANHRSLVDGAIVAANVQVSALVLTKNKIIKLFRLSLDLATKKHVQLQKQIIVSNLFHKMNIKQNPTFTEIWSNFKSVYTMSAFIMEANLYEPGPAQSCTGRI